jgi:transglutaminase-like putative cysteine protease
LLAVAAAMAGYGAIFPWLELLPRLSLPAAVIWLAWRRGKGGVIPSGLALLIALPLFAYFLFDVPRHGIVTPSVGFITTLLALRIVSEKSGRHYLQICALAIFLLAASSIYSLSPLFIVFLILLILVVTLLLILLTFSHFDEEMTMDRAMIRRIFSFGLTMQIVAFPLILVLFLILPRTPIPLWRFGAPVDTTRVGFSETVRPGAASRTVSDRIPVFRAEMDKVDQDRLYWRGTVLNRVDKGTWSRISPPPSLPKRDGSDNKALRQSIQLEPGGGRFLFALDMPAKVRLIRATQDPDGVLLAPTPITRRVRYEAFSGDNAPVVEKTPDFYLQLPPDLSQRLSAMAEGVRRDAGGELERIGLLEERFRNLGLMYAVQGLPTTADPIDTFLFSSKQGSCEFFASAYAMMLRQIGIPARLVGGYFGGTYNELGGYYLVTQDMAHVWVEYYREGVGWQRIDPTVWGAGFAGREAARSPAGFRKLRLYADTAVYFWDSRVIPFDFESQYNAVRTTRSSLKGAWQWIGELRSPRKAAAYFLSTAAVLMACLYVRRHTRRSRVSRLLRLFEKNLRRRNPTLPPLEKVGLFGLAKLSGDEAAWRFAELYGSRLYRDTPLTRNDETELVNLIKRF